MNPFSGFLQPRNQTLQGAPSFGELENMASGQRQEKQRALENTQQNTRANAYLGLQQAQQQRKFSEDDQKQVEGLLSEYHDALDTGDQERVHRATEMLKRFGMDVSQAGKPPTNIQDFTGKPNLRALTGQSLLPQVAPKPQEEPDLPQQDFEAKLINNPLPEPTRYEEGGQTTPEYRAMLAQGEPETQGVLDLDDPGVKAQAKTEGETTRLGPQQEAQFQAWAKKNGIADANDPRAHYDYRGFFIQSQGAPRRQGDHFPDTFKQHGHETFSEESGYSAGPGDGGTWKGETFTPSAQQASGSQFTPRLPTQLLPTVISKGNKVLETSNGQTGRYQPMVASVFQGYAEHENPEIAQAGQRAMDLASKLVQVDGISPKDAIEYAGRKLEGEIRGLNALELKKIGAKAAVTASGKAPGLMGKTEDVAESAKIYTAEARMATQKLQDEDAKYAGIEASANSGTPGIQKDAINQLLQVRSGTAVTASEDARVNQLNGMIDGLANKFNQLRGAPMTTSMLGTLRQIAVLKRSIASDKIKRIYDYEAEVYEAQNAGKVKDPTVFQKRIDVIRKGGTMGAPAGAPKAEEDLY